MTLQQSRNILGSTRRVSVPTLRVRVLPIPRVILGSSRANVNRRNSLVSLLNTSAVLITRVCTRLTRVVMVDPLRPQTLATSCIKLVVLTKLSTVPIAILLSVFRLKVTVRLTRYCSYIAVNV